jgi:hypothetical protein
VEQTLVSEVERLDVGRATPRPEFELQFPPGAVVQGPGKNEIAVVRRDGTLRPVTQGELAMGISFDDLMESSPVSESVQRRPFWRDRTAAIAAVALVLIAAVLIVLRLRQRT